MTAGARRAAAPGSFPGFAHWRGSGGADCLGGARCEAVASTLPAKRSGIFGASLAVRRRLNPCDGVGLERTRKSRARASSKTRARGLAGAGRCGTAARGAHARPLSDRARHLLQSTPIQGADGGMDGGKRGGYFLKSRKINSLAR
jgi:hypothetical protein